MQRLKNIDDLLAAGERTLVVGLYTALALLIAVNIATRNLLQLSFQRLHEIAPALVLWLALLGATLGLKHNRHIRLELFLRFFPERTRRAAERIVGGFGLLVMSILFAAALQFTTNEIRIFGAWGTTAVIFPLFFALAAFRFFIRLFVSPPIAPGSQRPTAASPAHVKPSASK